MKHSQSLALLTAMTFLFAGPLVAQDNDGERPTREAKATEKLPTFIKAPIGSRALVTNADSERLGIIRDHVINNKTKKVAFVIVEAEGKEGARTSFVVPYKQFAWNAPKKSLQLSLTAEALRALPEYDPKRLQDIGGAAVGAGSTNDDAGKAREATKKNVKHLATSKVLGSKILAQTQLFATVDSLILEPNSGTVLFVLAKGVDAAADPFVVPFEALTWKPAAMDKTRETEAGNFIVTIDAVRLADAPKLEAGDPAKLNEREMLTGIFRFYGVAMPTFGANKNGRREG